MNNLRNRYLLVLDAVLLTAAPFLLFALRFEGLAWPEGHFESAREFAACGLLVQLAVYFSFGLYRRFWRFASVSELKLIFAAGVCAGVVNMIVGRYVVPGFIVPSPEVPFSVLFSYAMLSVAIIAIPRVFIRMQELTRRRRPRSSADRRVLVVGAGSAGHMIARELAMHPTLELSPIGFVDDDRDIHGLRIENIPVLGGLADIPHLVETQRIE
ncbi:MAG: polysaccharide biosynthesis protein CapD, partial [Gemmatimonadetes bacterium]|nr:polysaccharide biosynthesis protein CapD [Gemmatimonadota bacterium]